MCEAAGCCLFQTANPGQATVGTTSASKGILVSQTLITLNTGATLTGRALALPAVALDATAVTGP